jgi:hypothetical protein
MEVGMRKLELGRWNVEGLVKKNGHRTLNVQSVHCFGQAQSHTRF